MSGAFRFSVPALQTRRGAGLGNEVLAWGKAFIGAQELGLKLVRPAWGLNQRGYWKDFGGSRADVVAAWGRAALPSFDITAGMIADYPDYADAMRSLAAEVHRRKGPLVVRHASGMSGGYLSIRQARTYLLSEFMRPRHVAEDLYQVWRRVEPNRPVVGMHVRGGDFSHSPDGPRPGEFNKKVPIDWYANVGGSIRVRFPQVQFLLFTDDPHSAEVRQLAEALSAVELPYRSRPVLSDVLSMSQCDLMVCSVSSLSMLVGFLSDKPYIWFRPQLDERDGALSIWGHEAGQANGPTAANAAQVAELGQGRAFAVPRSGALPNELSTLLEANLSQLDRRSDLLYYGVLPPGQECT